jgi:anti-anti-sigma factor
MRIDSELAQVAKVDEAVRALARELGFDEATASHVELAIHEAVVNAVVHGNRGRRELPVEVSLGSDGPDGGVALVATVRDHGGGFDPASLPDPLDARRRLASSGRGILLMRALMDTVEHSPHPQGGTSVRLVKQGGLLDSGTRQGATAADVLILSIEEESMKISTRKSGNVTILDLEGQLTVGSGDQGLRGTVREALSGGARSILVNMEQVTAVDSSGMGELVASYTSTLHHGGKLKLLKLPPKIHELLLITQLISVFQFFADEKEAVDSFS